MSPRTARLTSRALLGVALVMIATAFVVGRTFTGVSSDAIVVVPNALAPRIAEGAALLRANPNIELDPALADAPNVMQDLEDRLAEGRSLTIDANTPTAFFVLVFSGLWMGTGSLIVSRQPRNLAGWLFLVVGILIAVELLCQVVVFAGTKAHPGSIPLLSAWAVVGEYAVFPFVLLPLLWLLFPDGRPPSARWGWVVRVFLSAIAIALATYVVTPGPLNNYVDAGVLFMNPLGVRAAAGFGSSITAIAGAIALVLSVATIFAVRGRFKRSSGDERQQLRWLVFVTTVAGSMFVVIFLAGIITEILSGTEAEPTLLGLNVFNVLFALLSIVIVLGIPAAYLVAIYRYRLWDLDVVIKKAVIFAVVAGGLTIVSLAVLLFLPVLVVGGLTGWERGLLVVGIAIGTLFGPFRRLARRIADRVVYHTRATPYEVLTEFSGRVGETYATEDVLPRMAAILAQGTGASSARVLLRVGGELQQAAGVGEPGDDEHVVPVSHQGEELGALAVSMPANDPLDPGRERLIRDLAAQAGPVLRNVRLIEELRASRQRLVAAQDAERRRIERNIHDGAQQQLVALAVKLRLAEQLSDRDPAKSKQMLAELQAETTEALENLRDLARGIYPPLLADRGLGAALEAQARKSPVPTTVEADGIGRFAPEIEATVYFCALEALQNVARYARATSAAISLEAPDGALAFRVEDDGRGFDASSTSYGTGLQGMADRLDAVGGSLEVRTSPGAGTTIIGRVPTKAPR